MEDGIPTIPVKPAEEDAPTPLLEPGDNAEVTDRTFAGLRVLALALLMGALADGLLRARPYGLNVPLFVWPLVLCAWMTARRHGRRFSAVQCAMLVLACLFSAMVAWRAANMLRALDVAAVALALALAAVPDALLGPPLSRAGFLQFMATGVLAGLQTIGGALDLLQKDIRWSAIPGKGAAAQLKAAALGVMLAIPVLFVFGLLLVRADAAFESTLTNLFQFDPGTLLWHAAVFFLAAWATAGFLRMLVPAFAPGASQGLTDRPVWSLGSVTVCIPLALTNLLFLSFVIVQLQQLFGGHAWVRDPHGPTYAEYARRGFVELAMVVSLALPLLLVSDWSLRDAPKVGRRVFRGLSAATLLLLLTISASALHRMYIYMEAYGLTKLRLYTTVFMLWMVVVTLWFAFTILRERHHHFAFGVLVTGLSAILLLNAANPDLRIARVNLQRAHEGKAIDGNYLLTLSTDAAPAFRDELTARDDKGACVLRKTFENCFHRWGNGSGDPRVWNWSRRSAQRMAGPLPKAPLSPPQAPVSK